MPRFTSRGPGGLARLLVLSLLASCASPAPDPVDDERIVSSVRERGGDDLASRLEETLAETGLDRRAPLAPSFAPALRDATLAYAPGVRRARRELEAARAETLSAGSPGPLGASAAVGDLRAPGDGADVGGSFDLFGVLGLEPSAAARALAEARVRAAVAGLEDVAWSSLHATERAFVRRAATTARIAALETLAGEAREDLARIAAYRRAGLLGEGPPARATAFVARLERDLENERESRAALEDALIRATGLPPAHPLLEETGSSALEHVGDGSGGIRLDLAPESLLRRLPALRRARLEHAGAEARLRVAAAARWPQLRLGSRLALRPDTVIPAGLIELSLPFPGSQDGPIAVAEAARARSREILEDTWLASWSALESARRRTVIARRRLAEEAPEIEASSARAWRAMRARLAIDPAETKDWTDSLEARTSGALALTRAREAARLAEIDLREAGGLEAEGAER
ncbi:MAG: hypothetical protein R3F20_15165 [Planctomycetota bacterium]